MSRVDAIAASKAPQSCRLRNAPLILVDVAVARVELRQDIRVQHLQHVVCRLIRRPHGQGVVELPRVVFGLGLQPPEPHDELVRRFPHRREVGVGGGLLSFGIPELAVGSRSAGLGFLNTCWWAR